MNVDAILDAEAFEAHSTTRKIVALVGMQLSRPAARSTALAPDGRQRIGMPVRNTKTMPLSAAWSLTRGRPPLGEGAARGGSSGSILCHSTALIALFCFEPCIVKRIRASRRWHVLLAALHTKAWFGYASRAIA